MGADARAHVQHVVERPVEPADPAVQGHAQPPLLRHRPLQRGDEVGHRGEQVAKHRLPRQGDANVARQGDAHLAHAVIADVGHAGSEVALKRRRIRFVAAEHVVAIDVAGVAHRQQGAELLAQFPGDDLPVGPGQGAVRPINEPFAQMLEVFRDPGERAFQELHRFLGVRLVTDHLVVNGNRLGQRQGARRAGGIVRRREDALAGGQLLGGFEQIARLPQHRGGAAVKHQVGRDAKHGRLLGWISAWPPAGHQTAVAPRSSGGRRPGKRSETAPGWPPPRPD